LIGPSPAYTCTCEFGFDLRTKPNGEKHCGNTDNCKDQDCGVGTCKDLIGDYTCICPPGHFIGKKDGVKTCVPVTCSDDTPSLDHGKQTTDHSGRIDFPTTLQYQCDQGYSVDGTVADSKQKFQAQCKPNGQLEGVMSCQKISCGTPRVLPFTKLASHTPRNSIEYEEIVKYECDEGYTIGGKSGAGTKFKVKCPADGILTDPEVCEPVYCGKAPSTFHGRSGISGDVFYGMHLEYSCDLGYTIDESATGHTKFQRTCQKDGRFSALGDGSTCKAIHGGKAPVLTNAAITEYAGKPVISERNSPVDVYYPHGLEYRCTSGYSENGSPSGRTKISTKVNSLGQLWPALPTGCQLITYTIRGKVKDARNGRSLNGVSVKIQGTTTNVRTILGFFVLSGLRAGEVKLEYNKQGFIQAKKTINVIADIALGGHADIAMSPKMTNNEWRAVVKWGEKPADLDTYGKFGYTHVSYYQLDRKSQGMRAILEHDDTSSYGPETLYMKGLGNCRGGSECDFKYQINDYGENGNMKDVSNAEVTLYTGDRVAGTWKIADCKDTVSRNGNWWHVFTIDGKSNKLKWSCNQGTEESDFPFHFRNFLAHPPHAQATNSTPSQFHKRAAVKKTVSHTSVQVNKTAVGRSVNSVLKPRALEDSVHGNLRSVAKALL